ncbi:MAG: CBS domain-containing protein [Methylobacillus sp.]|jgi:CBS domain-containing protein|nr:CBS domain-containing protein [Methylobacillus sp.]
MKTVKQLLDIKGHLVLTISPKATILEALNIMAEKQVGALLVMQGDRLVGIFSERDYARGVAAKNDVSRDTPVENMMTPEARLITITPEQMMDECINLINDKRIRHLPVLDNGKVVGVLSIGDLVKAVIEHQQLFIQQLEEYVRT